VEYHGMRGVCGQRVMEGWGCRDVKEEEETTPWAEQQSWEAEQIKKASMRVGSKDRKKKEYDLVFEDQIEFIMDQVATGDNLEVQTSIAPDFPPYPVAPLNEIGLLSLPF